MPLATKKIHGVSFYFNFRGVHRIGQMGQRRTQNRGRWGRGVNRIKLDGAYVPTLF